MSFKKELLDELIRDASGKLKNGKEVFGEEGIFKELQKALVERILEAEMTSHLGHEKNKPVEEQGNYRNGKSSKKILTKHGEIEVRVPRNRSGDFEPQLIGKYQRRLPGFDEKIISLYARGMTTREIQAHIEEIYHTEVSPDLISTVTNEVIHEVESWQLRPLESIYPILYLDAIVIKVRDGGHIINKSVYLAIGITLAGNKEVLGMWIAATEGAKFWLSVVNELKNRGVQDIFIACVDGLKGFPEAINATFPGAQVQRCIVHMIRNSMAFVPWKDRKAVAADLKAVYTACNEQAATTALEGFRSKWDPKYPTIGIAWQRNWALISPFLSYPDYIRKVIYTTNTIESINYGIRKVTKNRSIFPDDRAAFKLLYLALNNLAKRWNRPIYNWKDALNQFAIMFPDRLPVSL